MSVLAWDPVSEALACAATGCCVLVGEAAFWIWRARGRSVPASAARAAAVSASAVVVLAVVKSVFAHGVSALALLAVLPLGMRARLLAACAVAFEGFGAFRRRKRFRPVFARP